MEAEARLSAHDTNVARTKTDGIWLDCFGGLSYQENRLVTEADWYQWSLHVVFWVVLVSAKSWIQMVVVYDAGFWPVVAEWQASGDVLANGFNVARDWSEIAGVVDFGCPIVMVADCCPSKLVEVCKTSFTLYERIWVVAMLIFYFSRDQKGVKPK